MKNKIFAEHTRATAFMLVLTRPQCLWLWALEGAKVSSEEFLRRVGTLEKTPSSTTVLALERKGLIDKDGVTEEGDQVLVLIEMAGIIGGDE